MVLPEESLVDQRLGSLVLHKKKVRQLILRKVTYLWHLLRCSLHKLIDRLKVSHLHSIVRKQSSLWPSLISRHFLLLALRLCTRRSSSYHSLVGTLNLHWFWLTRSLAGWFLSSSTRFFTALVGVFTFFFLLVHLTHNYLFNKSTLHIFFYLGVLGFWGSHPAAAAFNSSIIKYSSMVRLFDKRQRSRNNDRNNGLYS